ncbi:MAG: CPBP family intramembrane metalloprotease [Methanobacteriota archaeon]|nr:MAG: CPBP family intramembrane metalloprotease [Euryarchaeota archaeon]
MNRRRWIAVFKAEYYTTTAKFRKIRKWIPILFFSGVIFFSFFLRVLIDYLQNNALLEDQIAPPIGTFFSIIAMFSFFTLFGPFVSPLGRSVYDGSAQSRREVALASPVKASELLLGNSLANLVFFLPFYTLVGTVSLLPFTGISNRSPLIVTAYVFVGLVLLILIGLLGGTLLTPFIFKLVARRTTETARAIVTLFISLSMIVSLPLLRYLLDVTETGGNLGWIEFLPFVLAASIIVEGIYGVQIGLKATNAIGILSGMVIFLIFLGIKFADRLYDWEGIASSNTTTVVSSTPKKIFEKALRIIPNPSLRKMYKSQLYASLRDVENLSRLTMGIAVTVFMLFALSSRGLFRTATGFSGEIENGILLFTLIISGSTVVFIEAASFTVQHKSFLEIVKSSPSGPVKFVISKLLQMISLEIPIFALIMATLWMIDYAPIKDLVRIAGILAVTVFALTCTVLAIFLLNPSDNEEDLTNFINLIIFYGITFAVGTIPVSSIITTNSLTTTSISFIFVFLSISMIFLLLGVKSLDDMDIETLSSPLSENIKGVFLASVLTFAGWIVLPAFSGVFFFLTGEVLGQIFLSATIPVIIPLVYFNFNGLGIVPTKEKGKALLETCLAVIAMLLIAGTLLILFVDEKQQIPIQPFITQLSIGILAVMVSISVIVEELFFREFLLDFIEKRGDMPTAMVTTSILFGILHFTSITSMVNAFASGIILVLLRKRTGSILFPILAHLTYNFVILSPILTAVS